ncbi:DUF885 domain-containing protein [Thalassotalea crassostreae]|uniref:DUF885 domain-containing protein n=1 Tax=Thalassotalea crassostreae TaxID=1763536 RepID=UPI000A78B0A2|nr:DUF885 domain-containing protein [Thalassotalea crassostreae]
MKENHTNAPLFSGQLNSNLLISSQGKPKIISSIITMLLVVVAMVVLSSCSQSHNGSSAPDSDKRSLSTSESQLESEKLYSIIDEDWQRFMKQVPEMASYLGDKRYNQKWTDMSIEAMNVAHQQDKAVLEKLATIDEKMLNSTDKTNYDLFKWQTQSNIEKYKYSAHLMPINQLEGVHTVYQYASFFPSTTYQDFADWLQRLEALPVLIEQNISLMRQGIEQGILPPKITISRIPAQIQQLLVNNPADSLYYNKFTSFPDSLTEQQQAQLSEKALEVIANKITPAYQKLYDFMNDEYLPACRDTAGVWGLTNGKDYYQHLIQFYTTTSLTADEIHEIGLKEVARNRAEMEKVIQEVNFDGSFEEFLHFLRTDPQFYYQTSEELLEGYQAISKRLDPQLPKLFGKLPRMPYGVIPIPDSIAPDTTTAYYFPPAADGTRAGHYYVNLYQPETRPKYEMEVLSVHEAVPGHHLQVALQMELGDLPSFRRYLDFTVFTEGWGLYSERLGYDMGLYTDPYSRFGQLTYDMWRAVRLVVDTGMHHKGWTRKQAIDYFLANAAKSEEDITNEIDRYISWPGQALAYKIGQLKIIELREQAENSLGEKFDIRSFHDMVLGSGSIPLNVLEQNVNQWISDQQGL